MFKYIFLTSIILGSIGTGVKFLYDKFTDLNFQVSSLKSKNQKLITKNKKIREAIKNKRKSTLKKKLSRTKYKLAKAPASMVPIVGATAVVVMTANDIDNYCKDIQEFKEFEKNLFGKVDENISEEEKVICGYDTDTIKKVLMDDIKYMSNESTNWIEEKYNKISDDVTSEIKNIF